MFVETNAATPKSIKLPKSVINNDYYTITKGSNITSMKRITIKLLYYKFVK